MVLAILFAAAQLSESNGSAILDQINSDIDARVLRAEAELPKSLSRFIQFPPEMGAFEFPRCINERPLIQNPEFWLKGIDLSCVSPWNERYGKFRSGTAISKRHIVFAKHFPLANGTRIAFVGSSGETSLYRAREFPVQQHRFLR